MKYIRKLTFYFTKILAALLIGIFLIPSSSFAATWTERQPAGGVNVAWRGVASDSDGSNLIVSANNGRLYTSSDSGANWTERRPLGDVNENWVAVASDSDGSNLIVGSSAGATRKLFTSSDSGANWTERQPAGAIQINWDEVASDADGSFLVAAINGSRLYTSSDSGANWTERRPGGDFDIQWSGVASDSDGSNLIVSANNGRLYTSSDSGANWTERRPKGDVDGYWWAVTSDDDGTNLAVIENGGRLYTSSDSGANWTERQPAGSSDIYWNTIASDADGSTLIVASEERLYVSSNSGGTWTEEQPAGAVIRDWRGVSSDSDGSNLAAAATGARLYTGISDSTAPTVSTLSPTDGATTVSTTANLVITFDEAVDVETGNITIKKSSDSSTVATIDVTSGNVTGTGTTTITINPTNDLDYSVQYYINIDATAFDDVNGNSYAGIADVTTWSFTIESAPISSSGSSRRASPTPPPVSPPIPPAEPTPPVTPPPIPPPSPTPPPATPVSAPEPSYDPAPDSIPEPTSIPVSPSASSEDLDNSSLARQSVFAPAYLLREIGKTAQIAGKFIREVAENSATKTVEKIAIIIPVTISAIVLFSGLLAGMPFLNYLFYLLVVATQLLGIKKTPKPWGTVYDSQTKRPIPFARVEILNGQNRKLQTTVADQNGRYGFLLSDELSKDSIYLQAFRTKYDFPSKVVPTPVEQTLYPNIYKGGQVNAVNNVANFDIPMDPRSQSTARSFYFGIASVNLNNAVTRFADVLFVVGGILSVTNAIINPNGNNFMILAVVAFTFLVRQSGFKLKPFGLTKNKETNQVLPFGFVSLYNQGGERVSFTVSDDMGRYFLLTPKGKYMLKAFTPAHISPTRVKEMPILTSKGWISKEIGL